MKEGGVARIALPDLERVVQSYDPQHSEDFLEAVFEAKQKHDKNKHHWHYNEISLTKLLKETEFSKVYRCKFREGNCANVALIDNRPESLFMETIK